MAGNLVSTTAGPKADKKAWHSVAMMGVMTAESLASMKAGRTGARLVAWSVGWKAAKKATQMVERKVD